MKKGFIISLCLFVLMLPKAISGQQPNVVIEEMTEHVRLIPDKSGTALKEIKHSTQYTFRANRSADKALAMAYYDDNISIDKASGGTVRYKPLIGNVFFSDSKACFVEASLAKKGAKAKVSFKRTFNKPEFLSKLLVYQTYDIERAVLKFEIPDCLADRYRLEPRNMPDSTFTVAEVREGNKLTVIYTITGLKKPKAFGDAPSINATAPQILLLGHFPDVNGLYRYLHAFIPEDDPGAQTVADKAREITSGCATDAEKINAISDFVHSTIRYIAVEHGEFGHRPDIASEVLRKRFGDCKGSAMLTRDMLRAAGFDARLVWIGTREIGIDWTEAPNISSGNHMITAVVLPSDSIIYLDGTARYSLPENPPAGIAGRQTIIEDTPESCIIGRVPSTRPEQNTRTERLTMTLSGDIISVEGTRSYTGAFNRSIRSLADEIAPGLRQEFYERIFCSSMPCSRSEKVDCTVNGDTTALSGTATIAGATKEAGTTIYVDMSIATRIGKLEFDTIDRNSDGELDYPATIRCIVTLNVPDGMTPGDLPAGYDIENDWLTGSVNSHADEDGRSITRSLTVTVKNPIVPLDMMKEYNDDLSRLIKACSSYIALKKL